MKREVLSRESWLDHALEVLRTEGIQGVRVERLARDLKVTKGSFYWHFEDLQDLHHSMLQHWADSHTEVVVNNPDFDDLDPDDGLLAAISLVREQHLDQYELAIRAWADHSDVAHDFVQQVYARRNKFVRRFFERLGFNRLEAEARTRLVLCYLCWEPSMYQGDSVSRRRKLLKIQHAILTRP